MKGPDTMDMLERDEWGATLEVGPALALPVLGVVFHHSVTIATDDHSLESTDDVAGDMREIEAVGEQRFGIFPYCYGIHPSGVVAVGAGLTKAAHTKYLNATHIGVVFIGNLEHDPLTPEAERAAVDLLRHLRARGALLPGFTVSGHRDHKATACPGAHVYPRLRAIHQAALLPPTNPNPGGLTMEAEVKAEFAAIRQLLGNIATGVVLTRGDVNELDDAIAKVATGVVLTRGDLLKVLEDGKAKTLERAEAIQARIDTLAAAESGQEALELPPEPLTAPEAPSEPQSGQEAPEAPSEPDTVAVAGADDHRPN